MRNIAELTMLLRGHVELPDSLTLATEEFREGWNLVGSGNAQWLDKEVRRRGWHFIWIAAGSLRSGVGKTSQEAIAVALKLALRRVSDRFNAAEVKYVELRQYPWFVLARVRVCPYQIQRDADLGAPEPAVPVSMLPPAAAVAIQGRQVAPAA
jgi:hypothetical protein